MEKYDRYMAVKAEEEREGEQYLGADDPHSTWKDLPSAPPENRFTE